MLRLPPALVRICLRRTAPAASTLASKAPSASAAPGPCLSPPPSRLHSTAPGTKRRRRPSASSRFGTAEERAAEAALAEEDRNRRALLPNGGGDGKDALLLQSADLFRDAAVNPRSQTTAAVSPSEPFAPDVPMDEYLTRVATLSPWVPCPDPVARRMLDLAGLAESPREAAGGKIHYDLGCGDGRVNFAALDVYGATRTVGIDTDPAVLARAEERLRRRHPRPPGVEFVAADLMDAPEAWEELGRLAREAGPDLAVTCYFVAEALGRLRPLLEEHLGGTGARIVTCGYEVEGWNPRWVETLLGLPIHLYEMADPETEAPTVEELRGSGIMDEMEEVAEKAAERAAAADGGGWRAEDKYAPPEEVSDQDYFDREDGHWDTFDDEDEEGGDESGTGDKESNP